MDTDPARRAKLFLGFAVVLLVFLWETVLADRRMPNPASPYVWALLGAGALACFGLAAWFHRKSRSDQEKKLAARPPHP